MSYYSEVGHAKNAANFEDLISRCTAYGVTYNPSLNAIKVANLNTLRTAALAALNAATGAHNAYTQAVDAAEGVFKPLRKFATRILSALKASGAGDAIIKDAKAINRKIQGRRAKPLKEVQTEAVDNNNLPEALSNHISVAQLSYYNMIDHYSRLIDLLSSIPAYNPNENELKVTGLNALLANLKAANTNVINSTSAYFMARLNRNDVLYKKDSGLVSVAKAVKNYVKSLYGTRHPKYKEVSAIKFTMRKDG